MCQLTLHDTHSNSRRTLGRTSLVDLIKQTDELLFCHSLPHLTSASHLE